MRSFISDYLTDFIAGFVFIMFLFLVALAMNDGKVKGIGERVIINTIEFWPPKRNHIPLIISPMDRISPTDILSSYLSILIDYGNEPPLIETYWENRSMWAKIEVISFNIVLILLTLWGILDHILVTKKS